MENKRIVSLDLMKFIAILMVLALHAPLYKYDFINDGNAVLFSYFLRLLSEGVPLFLLVNGFLLFRKEELDLKKHLKKIGKLFLLFVVWGLLYIIVGYWLSGVLSWANIKEIIIELLSTTKYSDYTSHLWFIQALIVIYFVYPLIWRVYKSDYRLFRYGFIVLGIFTIGIDSLQLLRDLFESCGMDCRLFDNFIWFTYSIRLIEDSWHLFYFMLGGIVLHNYENIKTNRTKYILLGVIGIIGSSLYSYVVSVNYKEAYDYTFNYGSLFMSLYTVGTFAFCMKYENKENHFNKFVSSVAKNTFGIYLLNKLVIKALRLKVTTNGLAVFILAFIVSYLLSYLINKIPGVKKMINV